MAFPRFTTVAQKVVALTLLVCAAVTLIGVILLWPTGKTAEMNETLKNSMGMDDELTYAKVIRSGETACDNVLFGTLLSVGPEFAETPDAHPDAPLPEGRCPAVAVQLTSGNNEGKFVLLNNKVMGDAVTMNEGQRVRLSQDTSQAATRYVFEDLDRRTPLAIWLFIAVLVVFLASSWKGLRAVIGVMVTLAVVVLWILPAVLSGRPVMVVAVVGSAAALFLVMFFVHGFSWKTASALLATLISLLAAVAISRLAVLTAHITGMSEAQNVTLQIYFHQLPVLGLVIAGFIIGAIGVLNDVTISQAATVFELAEMDPSSSPRRVFEGAMRVGQDHVSSMLYTLVLAYTGSALPLLLFIQQSNRGLWEMLNGEVFAIEILRAVAGIIALTLSFPLTNAIATWLAVPDRHSRDARRRTPANKVADSGSLDEPAAPLLPEPSATPAAAIVPPVKSAPDDSPEEDILEGELIPLQERPRYRVPQDERHRNPTTEQRARRIEVDPATVAPYKRRPTTEENPLTGGHRVAPPDTGSLRVANAVPPLHRPGRHHRSDDEG